MNEKPRRRWVLRFSLRTMFVVVTLLCCWLAWQTSVVRERRAFIAELKAKPAYQITPAREWKSIYPPGVPTPPSAKVPLVRGWLGDEAIQDVWITRYMEGFSETDLTRIAKILPEATMQERLPEPCHPGCFPRGTLVDTPSGARLIETIAAGEIVTAVLASGETATAKVQSVFITDNRLWKVDTDGGALFTTQTQPLCLSTGEIKQAGELHPGDTILCRQDGENVIVKVLSVTPTDRAEKVFNLILGNSEVFVAEGFLARSKPPAEIAAR